MDKFTQLSVARERLVELYDRMFESRNFQEDNEFATELNMVANEIWGLMTGSRDMPPVIELCLPSWHKEYLDPKDLIGGGK